MKLVDRMVIWHYIKIRKSVVDNMQGHLRTTTKTDRFSGFLHFCGENLMPCVLPINAVAV